MSVIYGVLEEEREHLESALKLYSERVAKMPRGSLWIKRQGNRRYAYLAYREGGKVHFQYIAPIPSRKHTELEPQVKERRILMDSIRKMKKDLRIIERTLKYAKRGK